MDGHDWTSLIALGACLVLAIGALRGHQLDWRKGTVMAMAWAAIFAGMTLAVTLFLKAQSTASGVVDTSII